jgi:hypothetical protein
MSQGGLITSHKCYSDIDCHIRSFTKSSMVFNLGTSESERNTAKLENSGSSNIASTSSEQTAEIDQRDTNEDIYGQTVDQQN